MVTDQAAPPVARARRSDAGAARFTARDIAGLVLTGEMYAAPYDLLGLALAVRQDRLRAITARWRRAGLAESGRIGPARPGARSPRPACGRPGCGSRPAARRWPGCDISAPCWRPGSAWRPATRSRPGRGGGAASGG